MPRTAAKSKAVKPATKKGFNPKTFKGMSKKRMAQNSGTFGMRVPLKPSTTVPLQFLQTPEEATEFEVHAFQEDGRWEFVPCAGDNCPLCQSDSDKVRRTSYRFLLSVYNIEAKKVQVLEGPQSLAQQIFYRFERKPSAFLKRTFEVTRFPTNPTTYNFELGEDPVVSTAKLKPIDHDDYLIGEMKRYYGEELPEAGATALDDDEDDEELDDDIDDEVDDGEEEDDDLEDDDDDDDDDDLDDDEEDDDDEDLDDDDDDEDDEDDDDEDDDDDDDEDDEPPARSRRPAKKAPAKKAATPAKKAAKSTKKAR